MVFPRRKPTTTNTFAQSPRKFSPPINFLPPPNRTTREKVVASPSVCTHENRYFLVDSGASLHMMSKKELISGEQDTIRRSNTTASGKAVSTEEAKLYVNDLDVFVTMMLLENSPAVLSLGQLREEMDYSYEWEKEESPLLGKDGKNDMVQVCETRASCGSFSGTSYL